MMTSLSKKLLAGLFFCGAIAGGLLAQPQFTLTTTGTLGPLEAGSGVITTPGTYLSGVTADSTSQFQYCEIQYTGGTTHAIVKIFMDGSGTGIQAPKQTISANSVVSNGAGYSDTTPPTTATVIAGAGTAKNCTGSNVQLQGVKVDDPLGLVGVPFTTTVNIDPVGLNFTSPTQATYSGLTLLLTSPELSTGLSCAGATATVNLTNNTLSFGNCNFTIQGVTAGFTSTLNLPPGLLPVPIPVTFAPGNLANGSSGTYTFISGSPYDGDFTTLGITGGAIAGSCTGCPVASVSTNSIPFAAQQGSTTPQQQQVTISTNPTYQEPFEVLTSTSSGGNWLSVSSAFGQTGSSFNVIANPTGLAAGSYTGTVSLYTAASNVSTTSPLTISVTFVVSNQVTLTPNPTSFTFTSVNNVAPPSQSLSVSASSNIAYTATPSANWITLSATSGTTNGAAIQVSVNPALVSPGVNSGSITLSASGAPNVVVPVTFNDTTIPTPSALTFTAIQGSSNPASQQLSVNASAGPNVPYTASASSSGWLAVSPNSGTTGGPALTVSVNITGLTPNTYNGTIVISAGGATINVPVSLTVTTLTPSPTSLTFNYTIGGNTPNSQPISVSSGSPITYSASASSGANWLSVSPTSATTPNTLTASVNAASLTGLAAGSYSGTITLTPNGASSGVTVSATLVISPAISVSSSSLSFAYQTGQASPPSQTLNVTSNGAQLNFTASASGTSGGTTWLSVSPTSGTTPQTLTVSVAPSGLAAGNYNGTITISSSGAGNSPVTVQVTLQVSSSPLLTTAPSSLTFNYTIGGTLPASSPVSVTSSNPNSQITGVSAVASTNWLSVSSSGSTTPVTLTVSLVQANLPAAGTYPANITITGTGAGNSPLNYPVTLIVAAQPSLTVSPSSLTFNGTVNGTNPAAQNLAVNSLNGSVSFTAAAATISGGPWLSITPTSGSTNAMVQVSVNLAGLAIGTYNGSVTITASGATGSPAVIPVTLTVSNTPNLILNPTTLTFNYTTGAPAPAGQNVAVSTSNSSAASYTVATSTTTGGPWLKATPTSGTSPSSFSVTVVPGNLTAGTYIGTVTVSATGYNSATVSVTMVITQAKATIQITGGTLFVLPNTAVPTTSNLTVSASDGSAQAFTIAATPGQFNWLTLSPTGGTTPATVKMTINPAGLIPGIYVTPVTVTMPGLPVTTKTIQIQLTVSGSNLQANPSTLTFTYQPGLPLPAAQTISLTPISGGTVTLASVTTDVSWLVVTPAASAPATLTVSINPGLLSPGTFTGNILVKGTGSPDTSLAIPVTITVNAAPVLTATPNTLTFNYQPGTPLVVQSVAVSAAGNLAVNYTTATNATWLQVTPAKGTLPGNLLVSVMPTGLGPGTYNGTITVTAVGAPATTNIAVTLTIAGQPQLTFSTTQLFFAMPIGGALPLAQNIAVSSNGGAINFTATGGSIWLGVTPSNATTPATLSVTINPGNLAVGTYTGTINLTPAGGATPQMITVTLQIGSGGPTPTLTGVINAASGAAGKVSPGMAVSIFGTNLGPATGVPWAVPAEGQTVATTLSNTDVLFDNLPVPLLYTSAGQVNALVPFEVAGKASTMMTVVYNGVTSASMTLTVVPAEPGIFTADATGKGQGAIENQDFSVNSASNPAAQGSVIMIYATGGGVTDPVSVDGGFNPISSTGSLVTTPVTVTIGGQPAQVTYSGPAPGLVAGIIQINAVLPPGLPSGDQVVGVTVGDQSSQAGVTVAVQ